MRSLLLQASVLCLGFRQSLAAVPWQTFGCDGFVFTGTHGSGKSVDEVWDNAVAMTTQAESQIDLIPREIKFKVQVKEPARIAGANGGFMFGTKFEHSFGARLGLSTEDSATMDSVKASFGEIRAALEANLLGKLRPDNAYFFCGSGALKKERVPSDIVGPLPIWHLQIPDGDTTTYVLFSFVTSNSPKPCEERGDDAYLGKTFESTVITEGQEPRTVYGVIMCPNQWFTNSEVKVWPTLETGFKAESQGGNKYPYPAHYNSMSGTLVHEMAHVVARVKGGNWLDIEYGFVKSKKLAEDDSKSAVKNPDSYRIFAEMSMSPATRWNAPAG